MNRLVVRLVVSHVLVALLGAGATFLVVRQLAPALFDAGVRMHAGGLGSGGGRGAGRLLRQEFGDAVDNALLVGVLAGALAAAVFGAFAAFRLLKPLDDVRAAARDMARGNYATTIPAPPDRELAQLAADIEHLGRSLAQTETRRLELIGEVAHEMRTPLTVIDGTLEGMIDGILPATPDQLGLLSDETRRLSRLADDLASLSRTDENRLRLTTARLDLRDVADAACRRLLPQAADAGLDLVIDLGAAPLPVVADADRMAQVVTNLVGNALRATPAGGSVTVSGRVEPGSVVLTVTDTGEGLAPEDLERVFERFYRVERRRRSGRDTGSGIGLTIARGIVRAHGGELTAASPGRGRGAAFSVRLPSA